MMPQQPESRYVANDIVAEHYMLCRNLGGGHGDVWQAIDTRSGTFVVIKWVRPSLAGEDRPYSARFEREANLLDSAQSDYVEKLLYRGIDARGVSFLVFEWLGNSLRTRIEDAYSTTRPIPLRDVAAIGRNILRGMEYVHLRGWVHRDLKPENISTDPVKLLDFGIARDLNEHSSLTSARDLVGTLPYAAPEQMQYNANPRKEWDVFSGGMILFEILGAPSLPAALDERAATIRSVLDNGTLVSAFNDRVPIEVAEVLQRATHRQPERRYADGRDFLRDWEGAWIMDKLPKQRDASAAKTPVASRDPVAPVHATSPRMEPWAEMAEPAGGRKAEPSNSATPVSPPKNANTQTIDFKPTIVVNAGSTAPASLPLTVTRWTLVAVALFASISLGFYIINTNNTSNHTVEAPITIVTEGATPLKVPDVAGTPVQSLPAPAPGVVQTGTPTSASPRGFTSPPLNIEEKRPVPIPTAHVEVVFPPEYDRPTLFMDGVEAKIISSGTGWLWFEHPADGRAHKFVLDVPGRRPCVLAAQTLRDSLRLEPCK